MKTLFDICTPRPDVKTGNLRDSDLAADLAQVISGTAPDEYKNPAVFFANTYPTKGLKALLKNVCQRLSGVGGSVSAVFRLDTQYGGGKTHSLIALTHAVQGMKKVAKVEEFVEPTIVPTTHVRLAAFDGENADPVNGRLLEEGLRAYTPWGEIAYALAGADGYEKVKRSDIEKVAPGADTIRELFGNEPSLILLDELSIYLRKIRGRNEEKQLTPFLTALFKAVSSSERTCVVFTLAIGKDGKATDAYSEENEFVASMLDEATKAAGRVTSFITPTSDEETVQVLRRRLFSHIDEEASEEVITAYQKLWIDHSNDLPAGNFNNDRVEALRSGFPLHPAMIDLMTDKLSTLSNFQRVRGMLRLLSNTIAYLWKEKPANTYAIHLHHMDPGQEKIRGELVTRLDFSRFDPAIDNDVSSLGLKSALAQELDREHYAGLAPYASFVARTVLWNTFAFNENLQGVDEVNLRYAILAPTLDISFINDARQKFITDSAYLDDRPTAPLRFLSEVNLGVLVRRQAKQVDSSEARIQLQDRIRTIFNGKELNLVFNAGGAHDVPDEVGDGRPYLVLISYDAETVRSESLVIPQLVEKIYRTQGSQGNFRQLKNNLVFLIAEDSSRDEMKNKMTYRLALEAMRQPDRLKQLPQHQQEKVQELYQKSDQQIAITIQQCYRHLFYPSRNNRIEGATVDLAHTAFDIPSTSETPGNGQLQILRTLADNSQLLRNESTPLGPSYVRDNTPLKKGQIATEDLRLEFRKDPRFPMMLGDGNFDKLIRKGVEEGVFVYQRGDLLYGQGEPSVAIQIDQQSFVYTSVYAKEKGIFPRPIPEPLETELSFEPTGEEKLVPVDKNITEIMGEKGGEWNDTQPSRGTVRLPELPKVKVFKAEAPLREALTKIWEDAKSAKVTKLKSLSLRVFDMTDAFKLLGAITQVSNADKEVKIVAEYETATGSTFQMEFSGQPTDAQPIKDFLQPQLRAAPEKSLDTTLLLTYSEGLDLSGKEPENLADKLTRFATGAVFVEAYAEAKD
jgi:Protein of unknown function (DUF499)